MIVGHQQSMFDGDEVPVGKDVPVFGFDPSQSTNAQRVMDLARLGYLVEPVLDPTWGLGKMWDEYMPEHLVRLDANPERGVDLRGDFTALPFADRVFGSCLFDPPYAYRGTADGAADFDFRFGTDTYRLKAEITALVMAGASECARVTRRFLIVKCQRSVVAARLVPQPYLVLAHMEATGHWRYRDELHLMSYRAQPTGRRQLNSRSNWSTFLVLERRRHPISPTSAVG